MMKYCYYLLLFLVYMLPHSVQAQRSTLITKGDKAYVSLRYADAIAYYLPAISRDSSNNKVMVNLADSYYSTQQYGQALHWYKKIIQAGAADDLALFRCGQLLAMHGRYQEAAAQYRQYLAKGHADTLLEQTAALYETGMSSLYRDTATVTSCLLNISSGYADFSPAFHRYGMMFVSDRPYLQPFKRSNGWNGGAFLALYSIQDTARIKDVVLRTAELEQVLSYAPTDVYNKDNNTISSNDSRVVGADPKFNYIPVDNQLSNQMVTRFDASLSGRYHVGPAAFTRQQDTLAVTYNNPGKSGKDGISRLELRFFKATRDGWKALADFPYNSPDYSVGHPAFVPGGQALFFTSDMPGGLGGKDIWYCLRTDRGWSQPRNAGPRVNTAGNEMFPYVAPSGILYFSSDRWPGLGGLDIFYVPLDDQHHPASAPQNAGAPMNSARNDFGVLLFNSGIEGYFSSDRRGNDDIYRFGPKR
ncbi:tetratricopeptide repeat protein [Chitinophaga agrisoli]|nr:tetratricopeptide repeat protein [Chitinophaga agrisoli]